MQFFHRIGIERRIHMIRRNGFLALAVVVLLIAALPAVAQEKGKIEQRGKGYVEEILKTLDVAKGGTLYLTTPAGPVEVESWRKGEVEVRVKKTYKGSSEDKAEDAFADIDVFIDRKGDDVYVKVEAARRNFGKKLHLEFAVMVPEEYNLDLETKGGSIDIDDLEGNVKARTAGGSIGVGEITNGDVDVETKGGSISIDGVENGDCLAETAGGSISVGDVTGTLDVRTAGGSISLGNIGGTTGARTSGGSISVGGSGGDLSAKTAGGSIRIGRVDGDVEVETAGGSLSIGPATGDVDAHTSGGSIQIEESGGQVMAETSGGSIQVDGSQGPVRVNTAGGSIEISDAQAWVEARTSGGSIEAEMITSDKSADTHCVLKSSGGDLTLWIPEDLGASFDIELKLSDWTDEDYDIEMDFPLKINRSERRITCEGDINGGGDPIRLYTVNGDIKVKKLRR
jgi:DUF4097 and DUF4098 domain-containing protein YvlB